MQERYQCDNCYTIFEPYGDDDWLECPYCRCDKYSRFVIRLFEDRQIFEAYEFAVGGGQALHLFSFPGVYPGAPGCFKRSKQGGHFFDQNKARLTATAKQLGVRVIKVSHEGTKKQHVDLCGRPLKRALKLTGVIKNVPDMPVIPKPPKKKAR